jgi:hypothetical protein
MWSEVHTASRAGVRGLDDGTLEDMGTVGPNRPFLILEKSFHSHQIFLSTSPLSPGRGVVEGLCLVVH